MSSIQYVLFDVDGTLINTNHLIIEAFKHTFKKHLNVVTIDNTDEPKPSPKPVQKALEQLGYVKGKVLMVGDSPVDIQTARNAGILSAAVGWTMYPKEIIMAEKPDYVLDSPNELLRICLE